MQRRAIVLAITLILGALPAGAALAPAGPQADFTFSPDEPHARESITFQSTATSSVPIVSWEWRYVSDEGESSASGETIEGAFATAGDHVVRHTVTDALGRSASVERVVSILPSPPVAAFRVTSSPAYRNAIVEFDDVSTDVDDDIVTREWDFGDGATLVTSGDASHAYSALGQFTVTLTVRDSHGQTSTAARVIRILNAPPVVSASFSPSRPLPDELVSFQAAGHDPDSPGGTIMFEWRFSDGAVLFGADVARAFSRVGNHSVMLRGRDAEGAMSAPLILLVRVENAAPRVDFAWSPTTPVRHQLVQFTDLSAGGAPLSQWRWSFGDGATSTQPHPVHAYATNGTFTVTLQVTDAQGKTNVTTHALRVNLAPQARFTGPSSVPRGQPASFQDLSVDSDGALVNWSWDFGDGGRAWQRHPTHTFSGSGIFAVTLRVTDNDGATVQTVRQVEVPNRAPVASWSASGPTGRLARGEPVTFVDGSYDADGDAIVSHMWDFGDGATSTLAQPTHTFTRSGFHLVGLTVGDGSATSARTSDSHRVLRIGASHDVAVMVYASAPDGHLVDLSQPGYAVSATLDGVPVSNGAMSLDGYGIRIMLDRAAWVDGSTVTVRIASPRFTAPSEATAVLRDGEAWTYALVPVDLRFGVDLVVEPGERGSLVAPFVGDAREFQGDAVYADPFERPHGTGVVSWADGWALENATVQLQARYLGARSSEGLRDDVAREIIVGPLDWCRVAMAWTGGGGSYTWEFDGTSPCATNMLVDGTYAPGMWEVRAVAFGPQGSSVASAPVAFYVDPSGTIVLQATAGM